jgi:2-hydroxy-6-oxonona-2,4-dienedioate hydrolase
VGPGLAESVWRLRSLVRVSVPLAVALGGWLLRGQYRRDLVAAYDRVAGGGSVVATGCGPIQYAEVGNGPAVLIVHGAGGGYDQGTFFARAIGGEFRWLAPSRFGFLRTPVPDTADSVLQADAHAALLDQLNIDRVAVVGVSMGGPSALLFALRHPHRTTSLVLISAASHRIDARPALLSAVFEVFLHDIVYWVIVRLAPRALLAALGVPPAVQQGLSRAEQGRLIEFVRSIVPMAARRDGQRLEQHMSDYHSERIGDIEAPTLVVHARDDTLVPFEHAQFSAASIPHSESYWMTHGGHLGLLLDSNAEARNRVLQFVAAHPGR